MTKDPRVSRLALRMRQIWRSILTPGIHSHDYPPLHRRRVIFRFIGVGLLLAFALSLVGWTIVNLATPSALSRWDNDVIHWFYAGRTPTLDTLSHIGSSLADTPTCIAVLAIAFVAMRIWFGRWRESWTVFIAIVGELIVFLIVTAVVNRQRPSVPPLDAAPPTSSFPSGHTAAAIALYGCLAIIFLRQLHPKWVAVTLAVIMFVIPLVVGLSRLYRGMHYPTDVFLGIVGGGLWLAITLVTLLPAIHRKVGTDLMPASQDGTSHLSK